MAQNHLTSYVDAPLARVRAPNDISISILNLQIQYHIFFLSQKRPSPHTGCLYIKSFYLHMSVIAGLLRSSFRRALARVRGTRWCQRLVEILHQCTVSS